MRSIMTTPNPAREALSSPRSLAAWALVAYAALFLVFAFFDWVMPGGGSIVEHSAGARFTDLLVMAMPVGAALLAVHVPPALGAARLITTVGLLEYAVSLVFGVFAWLIGFGVVFENGIHNPNAAFDMLAYLALGAGRLALIAVAAFATYRAFSQVGGRLPVTVTRPAPPTP
jgi:hypothetical protein